MRDRTRRQYPRCYTWLAGAAFLAVCCAPAAVAGSITPANLRASPPDFTLQNAKGSRVTLSKYKGKVVLLNFWATWCGGCKLEIPWFMEFAGKYKKDGLAVIGVALDDEGWKLVKPYVQQKKVNYTIVTGDDALAKKYAIQNMPMTVLIGRDGKVAASYSGMVNKDACESEIRSLLQESRN